jgi:hypothetical protein
MSSYISSIVSIIQKYLSAALKLLKIKKWDSIQFLGVVFLIILVVSILFFSSSSSIKEGLLSDSNIKKVRDALKKYNENVTKICEDGIVKIKKIKFNSIEGMSITPILGDDTYTSIAKIDKITAIKSTNKDLMQALAEINGAKYTATQVLLNKLTELNITDDSGFTAIIKQHTTTPVISGDESTASAITKYLDSISVVNSITA